MHAPLSTNRQRYFQLLALVCEDLTSSKRVLKPMLDAGHEARMAQLMAVRFGRLIHLQWLVDMVRFTLPDYPIPAQVLPIVTEPTAPIMLGV